MPNSVENRENSSHFNKKRFHKYVIENTVHNVLDILKTVGMYNDFVIWKLKNEVKTAVRAHFPRFNINLQPGSNNTICPF